MGDPSPVNVRQVAHLHQGVKGDSQRRRKLHGHKFVFQAPQLMKGQHGIAWKIQVLEHRQHAALGQHGQHIHGFFPARLRPVHGDARKKADGSRQGDEKQGRKPACPQDEKDAGKKQHQILKSSPEAVIQQQGDQHQH